MSSSNIDESLEQMVLDIKTILAEQKGADEKAKSLGILSQAMVDDIISMPRRKLTTIYDLVQKLKGTSWTLQTQADKHKQLELELDSAVANIRRLQVSSASFGKYQFVDAFLDEWKELVYIVLGIDDLLEEVKGRCQDLISLIEKLKKSDS